MKGERVTGKPSPAGKEGMCFEKGLNVGNEVNFR